MLEAVLVDQVGEVGLDRVTAGPKVSNAGAWSANIQFRNDLETIDGAGL
tara:strand:+ start:9283 stop:9429 length:147 start_codon:yes stop_codon:yes gene_type:complete